MTSTGEFVPDEPDIDSLGAPNTDLIISPTKDILSLFLLQVLLILIIVRVSAKLLAKIRQPPVIGEIIAGVILGPSVLGYIPGFGDALFPQTSLATLNIFAQVGLIFFMFFLGLELDPNLFVRNWKSAFPISVISVLVPFALGCAVSVVIYELEIESGETKTDRGSFALFIGTTLAFTAFPLLARILTSFRLLSTPFGEHVLAIAACDDVLAWCTLALTLSYAGGATAANGVYTALITVAYLLVMILGVRPGLYKLNKTLRFRQFHKEQLNRDYICVLFLLLCLSSIWTEITGIHAFFGAFICGLCVPKDDNVVELLAPKIELIIVEFFLPLYFAYSGLRTTLGAMDSGKVWGICILVTIVACLGKIIPVTLMTQIMTRYYEMEDDIEGETKMIQRNIDLADARAKESEFENEIGTFADDTYSYNAMKTPSHANNNNNNNNGNGEIAANSSSDDPANSSNGFSSSSPSSSSSINRPAFFSASRKRYSWRTCLSVGLLMNTTGLVTLIALNVGLDRKLIGPKVFSLMVLMALITTFMTSPIFNHLFYVPHVFERRAKEAKEQKNREIELSQQGMTPEEIKKEETRRQLEEQQEIEAAEEEAQSNSILVSHSKAALKAKKKAMKKEMNAPFDVNQQDIHLNIHVENPTLKQSLTPPAPQSRGPRGLAHSHSNQEISSDAVSDDVYSN